MFSTLPNKLSILRIILSPIFFLLFVSENPIIRQISLAVFFLAAITDWYDGAIARSRNAVTNTGKFLDPLADKFLTSAAFIAFAYCDLVPLWMVLIIIFRDILITILRSIAEIRNFHIVTSKGAQVKTFIQMSALYYLLILVVGKDVGWIKQRFSEIIAVMLNATFIYVLMLIVTVLTLYTGIQYLYDNRKFLFEIYGNPKRVTE